jgi:predicted phosphodiesterase
MRIAALYDIHGNLPALEAVLDDVRRAGADHLLIGGDVLPGPMPNEAMECLLSVDLPTTFICGNGDREVLATREGRESPAIPAAFREVMRWGARELTDHHAAVIRTWPADVALPGDALGDVRFVHATARNDTEIFTRLTPDSAVATAFRGVRERIVVCGHTHMQFDRTVGATRIVNAGSVGMPFGEPGAYWLVLGPTVELRRTTYDLERAAEVVRATAYPQAAQFAEQSILQPQTEEQMLELFARAQIAAPDAPSPSS